MNIKKLIAILLLISSFSFCLVSCKEEPENDGGDITPPVSDDGGEEKEEETPVNPDEEEKEEENTDGENKDETGEVDPDQPKKPEPITYEEYMAMSADEKSVYFLLFDDYNDFFAWYNEAKAKYDEENNIPEIDGDIDIGDILGGNS